MSTLGERLPHVHDRAVADSLDPSWCREIRLEASDFGTACPAPPRAYPAIKRAIDLVGAILLVAIAVPALLLVALAVRLSSPGPALFQQPRVGKGGRSFACYKFRSMRVDADPRVHQDAVARYYGGDILARGNQRAPFKLDNDARVTRVGAALRRSSLDELPQLFNVIRGEMSLVGPRPALSYEVALYSAQDSARLTVLPGMTGLWQVKGRGRVGYHEAMALDLDYVRNRSLWLDCKILLLTIPAVALRLGAV